MIGMGGNDRVCACVCVTDLSCFDGKIHNTQKYSSQSSHRPKLRWSTTIARSSSSVHPHLLQPAAGCESAPRRRDSSTTSFVVPSLLLFFFFSLLLPFTHSIFFLFLVAFACFLFLVPGSWFCFCFPSPSLTCAERARYRNAGLSCRLEYSNRIINTRQIEPPRGPAAHHCAFIPTCTAGQPHSHLPDQTSAVFPSTVRPPARAPVSLAPSFPASCHTVGLGACSGEVSNLCGGDDDDYEYDDDDDDDDVILLHPSPSPNRPDQPWFNSQRFPSHSRDTPDSYRLVHRSFPNSVLQRVASCSIRYTLYK